LEAPVTLTISIYRKPGEERGVCDNACITIPTLEISIDMLKRLIYRDEFVVRVFQLPIMSRTVLGTVIDQKFSPLSVSESLTGAGLDADTPIFILVLPAE
jgi:hypothetical protein